MYSRLRASTGLRELVAETKLSVTDFIVPLFAVHGEQVANPIDAMPGVFQYSIDKLILEAERLVNKGVRAILLFGLPKQKDEVGAESYADDGIVPLAIKALKEKLPELVVITDVCMCSYTTSGHCGILKQCANSATIDHVVTAELLGKIAVAHAKAGADMVAPSSMTDGMIGAMRSALDAAGFNDTSIMSYAVKYASSFYGPFRQVADSTPQKGDRRTYQMDPANTDEAMLEAETDLLEGADILMVKPGLAYMDILARLKARFDCPLAAYHVSGEYAMVKAAHEKGWVDGPSVLFESLLALKRAGASLIITYAFDDVCDLLG